MNSSSALVNPARFHVWLSCWLAVVLMLCKGALLGLPAGWTAGALAEYMRDLAIMTHADVLLAAVIGLIGCAAEHVGHERFRKHIRAAFMIFCVACVLYGIASVQVFAYLRSHLTYPLIYLAGDMKNMRSSLGAFVTPMLLATLVIGPAAFVFLAWVSPRVVLSLTGCYRRTARGIGLCSLVLFVVFGHRAANRLPWADRVDRRVAENPHWVLVKSFVTDVFSDGRLVQLDDEVAPGQLQEFAVAGERARPHTANLKFEISDFTSASSNRLRPAPRPKNVIVYVLESVGAQHLGLYGSPYDTSACLQREAANSLVFDNFYAHCGVTANSLVAINLGIYPGMTWREYTVEQPNLPGTTLAALLKPRGYRTAYMTSGEIQYVNMDGFLKNRGYDLVCGYERLGCPAMLDSWGVEDRCLVDSILRWIDEDRERPFCVMAWTQQTHHPYEPSPGVPFIDFFDGLKEDELPPDAYDLGRYLNTLHEADRQLGRLFDELRRRGLADDTLVVVTGDHGEGFGAPHDIYGHGGRLFDEIVRVPLVVWNPRLFHPGRREATIGGHIDLNATLAEMLDLRVADSWQGHSLFDSTRPPRTYFFAANDDYLLGVREHDWKYIYNATIGRELLFELGSDPHEQTNLAADRADRCLELRQRLAAWLKYEEGHIAKLRQASNGPALRASVK